MNEEPKTKEEKKPKAKAKTKLVKMTRGETVAEVHPSEVDAYKKSGYE